ncbi:hypothetical protein [Pseudophaeobacter sp.]|uniref:hypothetical protein n=1 Tax=Pseudophaeobacter sp. TaxID=1971739 RepID=UPI003298BFF7
MHRCLICLPLLLGCCSAQISHFSGQPAVRVTVEGSSFDVRLRGNLAEATRINPQYAPRLGLLRARAARAMQAASGCQVTGVLGDQAVMTGILDCSSETD